MSGPIFHGFPLSLTLQKPKKQNWHLLALILIIVVATIIRLQNLPTRSLWWDEIWSVTNAQQGPHHILTSHDPARSYPFHLVLWLFLQVGASEWIARLPSAIYSILSLPIFYLLAKELYNRKTALLSTFMLSFWPYHVWYGQEARMYSLFFLVTVASMLLFLRALRRNQPKYWLGFLCMTSLGMYSHFYYVFVVGVQLLYLLMVVATKRHHLQLRLCEDTVCNYISLGFLAVVMVITSVPFIYGALRMLESGPGLNIAWGFTASEFWSETFTYLSDGVFGAIIGIPLFFYGVIDNFDYRSSQRLRDTSVLTVVWVFAPTVLLFMITVLVRPMTHNRYLIFILPAYLMMLAYGLIRVCERLGRRRTYFAAFLLATMIFGTFAFMTIVTFPLQRREDWRQVTQYINAYADSDDYVLIYPRGCDKCLNYYGIQHGYAYIGTHQQTVDFALSTNGTVWIVYYGWGDQKTRFEGILKPAGFETALYCYQISIYKR